MAFNFSGYLALVTAIAVLRPLFPTLGSFASQLDETIPRPNISQYQDVIQVDISDRTLCYRGTCYPVAVGSSATPTPMGRYSITAVDARQQGYKMPVLAFLKMQHPVTKQWAYAAVHEVTNLTPTQGCIGLLEQDYAHFIRQYPYYAQIEILY